MPKSLIADNIALLESGFRLLETMTDKSYSNRQMGGEMSGIGPHLRHCLDHYHCFLDGLEDSRVNYDKRSREDAVERFCSNAMQEIDGIIGKLKQGMSRDVSQVLTVTMDSGENGGSCSDGNCRSSIGRELQFLVSHTVHHFAMIAIFCRQMDIEVPAGFGVAPSTLKHLARN